MAECRGEEDLVEFRENGRFVTSRGDDFDSDLRLLSSTFREDRFVERVVESHCAS